LARLLVATGFGAVMPFAKKKKQKLRQPLAASSCHPTSSFFVFPGMAPVAPFDLGSRLKKKNGRNLCNRFCFLIPKKL